MGAANRHWEMTSIRSRQIPMPSKLPDELRGRLESWGQSHLVLAWDQLDHEQQQHLLRQLEGIDFRLVRELFETSLRRVISEPATGQKKDYDPLPATRLGELGKKRLDAGPEKDAGREGGLAVLLVAGGQGTRLGFDHPKGMLPVGPVSGRTLFEIFADQIFELRHRYQAKLPWLIMTSPATDQETRAYFAAHPRLGRPETNIHFFEQGTMPSVDATTGKVLLEAPGQVALSPDGHGGTLAAMQKAGLLELLEREGIDQLFYFQVDNPLVDIADPAFMGIHLGVNSEMTTQVVAKSDPLERVGNVVCQNGVVRIIEYSDLADDEAMQRTDRGELVLWAGSIAVHAFHLPFLRRMAATANALPFHIARKKVPYFDPERGMVHPAENNALKFERFIFDVLPFAKNPWVVEVSPADGFAPIKNAEGAVKDTLSAAQAAMVAKHRRWLMEAGIDVHPLAKVEIAPDVALCPSDLVRKLPKGMRIDRDLFLTSADLPIAQRTT